MAKQIEVYNLTAVQAHMAMVASGWLPLVAVRNAMHWMKDNRAAIITHEQPADGPLEGNVVTSARFISFVMLESGEILAL